MTTPDVDLIFDLVASQERVLMKVGGVVWEGHIQSCLVGTVVAAARPVGAERPFGEERFAIGDIDDLARMEPEPDTEDADDELSALAADMVERAREYEGLSLAERLIRERTERNERRQEHGGSRRNR